MDMLDWALLIFFLFVVLLAGMDIADARGFGFDFGFYYSNPGAICEVTFGGDCVLFGGEYATW